MAEAEAIKKAKDKRTGLKTSVTKGISKVKRLISEARSVDDVKVELSQLYKKFEGFSEAHAEYVSAWLQTEPRPSLEDETAAEEYFTKAETEYAEEVRNFNVWIEDHTPGLSVKTEPGEQPGAGSRVPRSKDGSDESFRELLVSVNMPKLELVKYNGDPLQYHSFTMAFDESVDRVASSSTSKLNRLVNYTIGEAHDAIKSTLIMGGVSGYTEARKILKDRFGNDQVICQAVMLKLKSGKSVKGAAQLNELSDELTNSNLILQKLSRKAEVDSQSFITEVVNRTEPYIRTKWRKKALDEKEKNAKYPSFGDLVAFIKLQASLASDPIYGESGLLVFGKRNYDGYGSGKSSGYRNGNGYGNGISTGTRKTMASDAIAQDGCGDDQDYDGAYGTFYGYGSGGSNQAQAAPMKKKFPCHYCRDSNHPIYLCQSFRTLNAMQRLKFVRDNRLCENCYFNNHSVSDCRVTSRCGVQGCKQMHSRLLHDALLGSGKGSGAFESSKLQSNTDSLVTTVFTFSSNICIPVVKVKVNNQVDSTAMLDTCSTATFITRSLAEELQIHSQPIVYDLSTLTSENVPHETGLISTLFVEGSSNQSVQLHNVHIIDKIPGCGSTVECGKYPHLQGLDVITASPSVGLLIGQDNAACLVPLEVRRGNIFQPFAVRTILGWSVHGSEGQQDFCGLLLKGVAGHKVVSNFIQSFHSSIPKGQDEDLALAIIKDHSAGDRGPTSTVNVSKDAHFTKDEGDPIINVSKDAHFTKDEGDPISNVNVSREVPAQRVRVSSNYQGVVPGREGSTSTINFNVHSQLEKDQLQLAVEDMWKLDQEGIASDECQWSEADKRVVELWDSSVKFKAGHYELPIPWKDNIEVPNNYPQAVSRLKSTRSSVEKKGILVRYNSELEKLYDKGFAEYVTPENSSSCSSKVWYLPHHAVVNDKKPDKLRVVFDCSASYGGKSLNDRCHQGPDLNNKLTHVLLRFRQHPVAVMADVESMFYQVRVVEEDRDALRFLWVDSQTGEEVVSRMNVHIFGGVWCPCIATYALRRTVIDQEVEDQFVCRVVNKSFYVDDLLQSVKSVAEARKVVEGVKLVLAKGGFNLTKFVSNEEAALSSLEEVDKAKVSSKEVSVSKKAPAGECSATINKQSKALGLEWNVTKDQFQVSISNVSISNLSGDVTRREMLRTIASMYDPLGFVSPVVMVGKMLFQEATAKKLDWDVQVPQPLEQRWIAWKESIQQLSKVSFPRCITSPAMFISKEIYQVHSFSDASEKGYGCCSYLKAIQHFTDGSAKVEVRLIASKSRVVPLEKTTIPRLELQAAVLSAQLGHTIIQQLELPIEVSYFWVDSQIALAYIQNEEKRLKTYVANRVAKILAVSTREQWKFVPGSANPADMISRGTCPSKLEEPLWQQGPDWLQQLSLEGCPQDKEIPEGDPEVSKKQFSAISNLQDAAEGHPIQQLINHFSDWYKLKKAVAWIMKVKSALLKKGEVSAEEKKMCVEDIKQAEKEIIKFSQYQHFSEEISQLRSGKQVPKSSSIKELNPVLNQEGILCVEGRLRFLKEEEEVKHPWILSKSGRLARMIVRKFHQKAHQGTEWTLALIRRKFWIVRARNLIKSVNKACTICKKLYGKPVNQKMSDLPEERLQQVKPFSHVGIDCFGPFYIKQGRHEIKRYGCIFTCMNFRAVHIEKLNSMETDSFINAFRRFMSRRGTPTKVWSDNGTNFVGASPELINLLKQLNQEKIKEFGLQRDVQWYFNLPHASHMGGVWERQIRTIRKILTSQLHQHADKLTDEVLETLFSEVESMINSRPLTKVSDDVNDAAVLSPNQMLMINTPMNSAEYHQQFHRGDLYKARWRTVQHLANQFWKRWTREYIPELQRRNKWNQATENLQVGDVVLICEEATPRYLWPLGLVVEVKVGRDKLVRTVKVKTPSTVLVRPVSKVVKIQG